MQKNSSVVWFVLEIRRRFDISAREFFLPYLHIGDICTVLPNKKTKSLIDYDAISKPHYFTEIEKFP